MATRPRTARAISLHAGGAYAAALLLAVRGMILARLLGPTSFGLIALLSLVTTWGQYSDLGASLVAERDLVELAARGSDRAARRMESTLRGARLACAGLTSCALVALAFVPQPSAADPQAVRFGLLVAAAVLPMQALLAAQLSILRARRNFRAHAAITATTAACNLASAVVGALWWGLGGVFVGQIAASALNLLISLRPAGRAFAFPTAPEFRYFFRQGLPLAVLAFAGYNIVYIDQVLVTRLMSTNAVGLYSLVLFMGSLYLLLPQAVAAVLGTDLLAEHAVLPSQLGLRQLAWRPVLVLSLVYPGIILVGWLALDVLVSSFLRAYAGVLPAGRVYLAAVALLGINNGVSTLLIATRRHMANLPIIVVTLAFNVVVDVVLVKGYSLGLLGVALGSLCSYALYLLLHLTFALHRVLDFGLWGSVWRVLVSAAPSVAMALLALSLAYAGPHRSTAWGVSTVIAAGTAVVAARRFLG